MSFPTIPINPNPANPATSANPLNSQDFAALLGVPVQMPKPMHDASGAMTVNPHKLTAARVNHRNQDTAFALAEQITRAQPANQPSILGVSERGGSTNVLGSNQRKISSDHLIPRPIYDGLAALLGLLSDAEIKKIDSKEYPIKQYINNIKKYLKNRGNSERLYNSEDIYMLSRHLADYLNAHQKDAKPSTLTHQTDLKALSTDRLNQELHNLKYDKQLSITAEIIRTLDNLGNIIQQALGGYQTLLVHLQSLLNKRSDYYQRLMKNFNALLKYSDIDWLEEHIADAIFDVALYNENSDDSDDKKPSTSKPQGGFFNLDIARITEEHLKYFLPEVLANALIAKGPAAYQTGNTFKLFMHNIQGVKNLDGTRKLSIPQKIDQEKTEAFNKIKKEALLLLKAKIQKVENLQSLIEKCENELKLRSGLGLGLGLGLSNFSSLQITKPVGTAANKGTGTGKSKKKK